jgi:hypothetical protein
MAMSWFNTLPGSQRSAPGLEWAIWKRLPAVRGWGTALPGLVALGFWLGAPDSASAAEDRGLWLLIYGLAALVVLHWTLIFTLAIGCAIVMVMKGPAYVADAYPPPGRDDTI